MKNQFFVSSAFLFTLFCGLTSFASAFDGTGITVNEPKSVSEFLTDWVPEEGHSSFYESLKAANFQQDDLEGIEITALPNDSGLKISGRKGKHSVELLNYVSVQVGSFYPIALEWLVALRRDERSWFDISVFRFEPSSRIQSISTGVAFHPFKNGIFVGAQARSMNLIPASSPYYDPAYDHVAAASLELGFRGSILKSKRLMIGGVVGATKVISQYRDFTRYYNVNLTVAYRLGSPKKSK